MFEVIIKIFAIKSTKKKRKPITQFFITNYLSDVGRFRFLALNNRWAFFQPNLRNVFWSLYFKKKNFFFSLNSLSIITSLALARCRIIILCNECCFIKYSLQHMIAFPIQLAIRTSTPISHKNISNLAFSRLLLQHMEHSGNKPKRPRHHV